MKLHIFKCQTSHPVLSLSLTPPTPALRGSEPLTSPSPRLCAKVLFGCGTLFGIHTHFKGTLRGQFLSALGVFLLLGEGLEGGLAQPLVVLRGSPWQIIDLDAGKSQLSHICECFDCY